MIASPFAKAQQIAPPHTVIFSYRTTEASRGPPPSPSGAHDPGGPVGHGCVHWRESYLKDRGGGAPSPVRGKGMGEPAQFSGHPRLLSLSRPFARFSIVSRLPLVSAALVSARISAVVRG